jgi:altronate dehydratase large subunit
MAEGVPGVVAIPHEHGCCQVGRDHEQTVRTLAGFGRNPNVAAVLVVSLGCEGVQFDQLAPRIESTGKPVAHVGIQKAGGEAAAIRAGLRILEELKRGADEARRVECDLAEIILGLECGGSDATSGIAANPAIGVASDLLVEAGGTSILSETTELIGAEHVLARRAASPDVARKLIGIVKQTEDRALAMGADLRGSQPTPGNIAGGITTIEEKSLGCIHKAGQARVEDVIAYSEEPSGTGLYMMDTPGQDIESITGMVAGGAQVAVFSTGRGTPTGCAIAPVIKVTGNAETWRRMADCLDINAGRIIEEGAAVEAVGREIFGEIVAVCNGRLTRAEVGGHREFSITRIGPTF